MIRTILLILLALPTLGQGLVDTQLLVNQVNEARKDYRRAPLSYRYEYQKQCDKWALSIRKSLIHNYSDKRLGEAISGVPDLEYVIPMFLASEDHKKVLMDKRATGICISVYQVPADTIVNKNSVEYIPTLYYTVIRTY